MLLVVNNNQQNKMPICVYMIVTMVVGFLVVGIIYHSHRCCNALHVRLMVSMFCKISHH